MQTRRLPTTANQIKARLRPQLLQCAHLLQVNRQVAAVLRLPAPPNHRHLALQGTGCQTRIGLRYNPTIIGNAQTVLSWLIPFYTYVWCGEIDVLVKRCKVVCVEGLVQPDQAKVGLHGLHRKVCMARSQDHVADRVSVALRTRVMYITIEAQ
jgi:hypothetical protein